MSGKQLDYSNTIFYKICCNDPIVKELYIGHTTNFVQRQIAHKQCCINSTIGTCKLYKVIRDNGGWNNWKMKIIAFHECDDLFSAKKHEQYYFEEYKATLNSIEPLPRTKPNKMNQSYTHITQMCIEKMKQERKFICNLCDFNCRKLSEYNRHLVTKKHKRRLTNDEIIRNNDKGKDCKNTKTYLCKCGKDYKHRSSLCKHKRTCVVLIKEKDTIVKLDDVENPDNIDYKSMFLDTVTQNKELVELLKEQSKTIQELVPKNIY